MKQISLDFLSTHRALWLLLAPAMIALAVWVYYRTLAPLERPTRTVLRVLRGLAFLIVLFALAEPVLTLVLPQQGKPGLAVLVDGSASMRFPGSEGMSGTRAAEATEIRRRIQDRLAGRFRLDWFDFESALKPGGDDARSRGNASPDGTTGTGSGNTAIGDAIEAVAGRQGTRPVGAVLLLTDGTNTVGGDPVGAARNAGVPVFPVKIGGGLAPPDARVLQIRTNPVAFSGEPTPVEVEIASNGLGGRTIELSVEDQGKVLATRSVELGSGEELEQSVRLDIRPQAVGLRRWEVRLTGAEDAIKENDTRSIAVRVMERKTRVLFVEGRLDWDYTFLRRVLAADSTFGYKFLLGDRSGRWIPERAEASSSGPGDLRDYAAVILGEAPVAALGAGFYSDLARYVEGGGGLLVLGGRSGLSRLRGTAMERLLPADVVPGPKMDRPLPVRLEGGGLTHPITAIEDNPARTETEWNGLPPVWPSPDRLRPRPGTSSLLRFGTAPGADPALIAGFAGEGKVVLFAAHDFWRWDFLPSGSSTAQGATLFPEFAMSLVRWLAEPAMRERFLVEPVRGVFQNGESPEFSARVWNAQYAPILDARVDIQIFPAQDGSTAAPIRQLELKPRGTEGTFSGQTEPLPAGEYRFVAQARGGEGNVTLGRSESRFWVDANGPEYTRLRADGGTLDQIARASGGTATDRSGLDEILSRLPDVVHRAGRVREIELWNHLALFLSFVTVLCVEWFLRRRRGLA
jgi:hypothetical protein